MSASTVLHVQTDNSPATRVLELPGTSVRVGRGVQCEVRLIEPALAEVQCILRRRGESWHIQPVGPAGRVTLNGAAVDHQTPLPLGVPLRVGDHWLALRKEGEAPLELGTYAAPITVEAREEMALPALATLEAPLALEPEAATIEAACTADPAEDTAPRTISEPQAEEPRPELAAPAAITQSEEPPPQAAASASNGHEAERERLGRWQARLEQRERWLEARQSERQWEQRWKAVGERLRAGGSASEPLRPTRTPRSGAPKPQSSAPSAPPPTATPAAAPGMHAPWQVPPLRTAEPPRSAEPLRPVAQATSAPPAPGVPRVEPSPVARPPLVPVLDAALAVAPKFAPVPDVAIAHEPALVCEREPSLAPEPPSVHAAEFAPETSFGAGPAVALAEPPARLEVAEFAPQVEAAVEKVAQQPAARERMRERARDAIAAAKARLEKSRARTAPSPTTEPLTEVRRPHAPEVPHSAEVESLSVAPVEPSARIQPAPSAFERPQFEPVVPPAVEPLAPPLVGPPTPPPARDKMAGIEWCDVPLSSGPSAKSETIAGPPPQAKPRTPREPSSPAPAARPQRLGQSTEVDEPPADAVAMASRIYARLGASTPAADAAWMPPTPSDPRAADLGHLRAPRKGSMHEPREGRLRGPHAKQGPTHHHEPTEEPPPRDADSVEWPSARVILAGRPKRARKEAAAPASKPRPARAERVMSRPLPTLGCEPAAWRPPFWLAFVPATALFLLTSVVVLRLVFAWSHDDFLAGRLADRLLAARAAANSREAKPPVDLESPPDTSWLRSTASHLFLWASALERFHGAEGAGGASADDVRFYLHAARGITPAQASVRLALAQGSASAGSGRMRAPDPPLQETLGLSRDIVAEALAARRLLEAGKTEASLAAFSSALEMAVRVEPARLSLPDFRDEPNMRRYALPYEYLLAPVVADMAAHDGWKFKDWSSALPRTAVVALVAARALRERHKAEEAEEALELAVQLADEPAPAGCSEAIHLAAGAEALAQSGKFQPAAERYRQAVEHMPYDTIKRSWWMNLADLYGRLDQDAKKRIAWESAKSADPNELITRRAVQEQTQAGVGGNALARGQRGARRPYDDDSNALGTRGGPDP